MTPYAKPVSCVSRLGSLGPRPEFQGLVIRPSPLVSMTVGHQPCATSARKGEASRRLVPDGIHQGTRRAVEEGAGPHPADDTGVAAEIECILLILSELEVVGSEAGVDEREFLGVRVEDRGLPPAGGEGKVLGKTIRRTLPAPIGVVPGVADSRGEPHPPLLVHHGVVDVGGALEDDLLSPEDRGLEAGGGRGIGLRIGVPHGYTQVPGLVGIGVRDQQSIVRHGDTVYGAVGVDRGIPLVRGDLVVHVGGAVTPVPQGEHDVPLLSLGPRGLGWDLAGHDPVGPVCELAHRPFPSHRAQHRAHARTALAEGDPMVPRLRGGGEAAVEVGDLPRDLVPELVTELAALFEVVDPRGLRPDGGADAVPRGPGAREVGGRRDLQEGVPVAGGIHRGLLLWRVRIRGGEHEIVPRRGRHRLGIGESVPPNPDAVARLGQFGENKSAAVVGDDDLGEPGGEVVGLRDDPDTGLGAVLALDHTGNDAVGRGWPWVGAGR